MYLAWVRPRLYKARTEPQVDNARHEPYISFNIREGGTSRHISHSIADTNRQDMTPARQYIFCKNFLKCMIDFCKIYNNLIIAFCKYLQISYINDSMNIL